MKHLNFIIIFSLFLICSFTNVYSNKKGKITFFAVSDTHFGNKNYEMLSLNQDMVDDMNGLPGANFPSSVGGKVDVPKTVIAIGDLTTRGIQTQWDEFIEYYGFNGEGKLNYQVFEGYGNHDFLDSDVVLDDIKSRNKERLKLNLISSVSENGFHYAWNWNNIQFIQLNAKVGPGTDEAHGSLPFLKKILSENVGTTNRPVILFHHYAPFGGKFWNEGETDAYYEAIKDYNIIGIFYGHLHSISHDVWKGIDIYRDGSVLQGETAEYLVVKIEGDKMSVCPRQNNGWLEPWVKTINLGTTAIPKTLPSAQPVKKNN